MLKKVSMLLVAMGWLLAACQGAASGTPATTQVETPTETSPAPTRAALPTTAAPSLAAPSDEPVKEAQCTVVSRAPTPGPTEQSLFPPPGDADWVVGADTASVTITEYSDFQ